MPAPPTVTLTRSRASAVTYSACGRFRGGEGDHLAEDLFLVKHNVLELYETRNERLVQIASVVLGEPPLSVLVFRPPGYRVDAIGLAFPNAQLSFLAFNAITGSFDTIAAVVVEDKESTDGMEVSTPPPLLRYDAARNLVAFFFDTKRLALFQVLPPQDSIDETSAQDAVSTNNSSSVARAPAAAAVVAGQSWGDEDDDEHDTSDRKQQDPASISPAAGAATSNPSASSTVEPAHPATSHAAASSQPMLRLGRITVIECTLELPRPLRHVRDVQFVPSFSEPTLAVLCEYDSTWAGRVKLADYRSSTITCKALSCSVVWLALSSSSNNAAAVSAPSEQPRRRSAATKHATNAGPVAENASWVATEIGDTDGVPYSATHLVACPPFGHIPGGVFCMAHHSLLHITPKRRFGLFLGKMGKEEADSDSAAATNWAALTWTTPPPQRWVFAAACLAFRDPTDLLFFGVQGDAVAVKLLTDGRSVVGARASAVGVCPSPSTATLVASGSHVFIGSAHSSSVLVRLRSDSLSGASTSPQTFTFVDELSDSLGNIRDADLVSIDALEKESTAVSSSSGGGGGREATEVGTAPADDSNSPFAALFDTQATVADDTALEPLPPRDAALQRALLVCSGDHRSGAVTLCHEAIRSTVVHRSGIECVSSHVLYVRRLDSTTAATGTRKRDRDDGPLSVEVPLHQQDFYLFLSTRNATIVLQARGESKKLTQLKAEESPFTTNARTVSCFLAQEGTVCAQVTDRDMVLLRADNFHLILAHPLRACGVRHATPFVHPTLQDTLFILYEDHTLVWIALARSAATQRVVELQSFAGVAAFAAVAQPHPMLLVAEVPDAATGGQRLAAYALVDKPASAPSLPTKLAAPEPLWVVSGFNLLRAVATSSDTSPPPSDAGKNSLSHVTDMLAAHLRNSQQLADLSPSLFVLNSAGECAVYRVALRPDRSLLGLFKKAQHMVDRDPRAEVYSRSETIESKRQRKSAELAEAQRQNTSHAKRGTQRLVNFTNVGGQSGVYVCGRCPRFYFSANDYAVYSHKHLITASNTANAATAAAVAASGVVRSFSPLSTSWLRDGYVSCCEGSVLFGVMPSNLRVHSELVTQQLRGEEGCPRRVAYCPATSSVFLITSVTEKFRPVKASFDVDLKILLNEDMTVQSVTAIAPPTNLPVITASDGIPPPLVERYRVELARFRGPTTAAALSSSRVAEPGFRIELDENEEVLACQVVTSLKGSGCPSLLVLGTAFPLGEDVATRGRLWFLRATANRQSIVVIHKEPCKGPVTALCQVGSGSRTFLAAAIGGTVKIFSFDPTVTSGSSTRKLLVHAFTYSGLYVTSMESRHNLILIGDLHRSSTLARFVESDRALEVLGRHDEAVSVVAQQFLYRGEQLGLVIADAHRSLHVLSYLPLLKKDGRVKESRLAVESDGRIAGGSVRKLVPLRRYSREDQNWAPHNKLVYVTNYGEVGYVLAISEQDHRAAQWLSKRLVVELPHAAALHPRNSRAAHSSGPSQVTHAKSRMVDGDLLVRLGAMSVAERRSLCAAAGTQLERTLALLQALDDEATLN